MNDIKKKIQLVENSWIAKIAAWKLKAKKVAIVVGSKIHLHNTKADEFLHDDAWVSHELKHVEQYSKYGMFGFVRRYVVESIKKGYYNNKFESEARNAEADIYLKEKFDIIRS